MLLCSNPLFVGPKDTDVEGLQMRAWMVGIARRGRDWPDLVGRRDVQLGPRGRHAKAGSGAA
jgi:hypothetical protein